jgi:hypothetical protein
VVEDKDMVVELDVLLPDVFEVLWNKVTNVQQQHHGVVEVLRENVRRKLIEVEQELEVIS